MGRPSQNRVTLSERVVAEIANLIKEGRLRPGDRLPSEYELMRQFGVGRSSVREALKGLTVGGVLERKPKRGTVVVSTLDATLAEELATAVAYWEIRDLYEIRMLLEGEAAALAAVNATKEDISEIQRWHKAMVRVVSSGASHFTTNSRFHVSIAKASHSGALVTCIGAIVSSYRSAREQINQLESVPDNDIRDHMEILRAIRTRQPNRAKELMQFHLKQTILRLEEPAIALRSTTENRSSQEDSSPTRRRSQSIRRLRNLLNA